MQVSCRQSLSMMVCFCFTVHDSHAEIATLRLCPSGKGLSLLDPTAVELAQMLWLLGGLGFHSGTCSAVTLIPIANGYWNDTWQNHVIDQGLARFNIESLNCVSCSVPLVCCQSSHLLLFSFNLIFVVSVILLCK